jgi:hypothetical protein
MDSGQALLAESKAEVLKILVECCTQRRPARIIHEKGYVNATFESASVDTIWYMNSDPARTCIDTISPCSVAFMARRRPCFFLSTLYLSNATKMFVHNPDRIAVVERREGQRYPVPRDLDLQVRVTAEGGRELTVRALDLSSNGILIEHAADFQIDWSEETRINVNLRFDSTHAELPGVVRRRAGTNRYGIRFPAWLSREHLRTSHPFVRILSALERHCFTSQVERQIAKKR